MLVGPQVPLPMTVQSDEQILEYIAENFSTIWHAACTCAMGKVYDTMAVVDARARVIGVQKLRVVDASILPILIPG